jgi:uncharacterized RDD family membrane protein YckC
MGSALLNRIEDRAQAEAEPARDAALAASAEALRQEVAARLAAHRSRRAGAQMQDARPAPEPSRPANSRSARIASAVAERYAHTQSYRAFLAAESERAVQQARAAAEVAALNAQAVAAAQQRLLDAFDEAAIDIVHDEIRGGELPHEVQTARQEGFADEAGSSEREVAEKGGVELDLWPELEMGEAAVQGEGKTPQGLKPHRKQRIYGTGEPVPLSKTDSFAAHETVAPAGASLPAGEGLTVRLYEDAGSAAHMVLGASQRGACAARANRYEERNEAEALALDEEIAFRQAPVFEEPAGPPVPLPANLIEFPRQLVASRKARPRYAEGPLREDGHTAAGDGQLRIFEVDVAQISTRPAADFDFASDTAATPQWTSIWLDTPQAAQMEEGPGNEQAPDAYAEALGAHPGDSVVESRARAVQLVHAATMGRRIMAAAINGTIVLTGLLAFAVTFPAIADPAIQWRSGVSLHMVLGQMAGSLTGRTGLPRNLIGAASAVTGAFLVLLYQALFSWFADATPGMRCMRIALCTFDDENPTRRSIRRRMLAVLLSACPLGLGFLWAALDEDRLTWHDRIMRMYQRSY